MAYAMARSAQAGQILNSTVAPLVESYNVVNFERATVGRAILAAELITNEDEGANCGPVGAASPAATTRAAKCVLSILSLELGTTFDATLHLNFLLCLCCYYNAIIT